MSCHVREIEPDKKATSITVDFADPSPSEVINVNATPKLQGKQKSYSESNGFLSAPLSGPVRPMSPDTLSNLSAEDYEQMHAELTSSMDGLSGKAVVKLSGWRGKLQAFWVRNKGLALVLLSQVFGVGMNVTTRVLEVEGNKGKGLNPFQIIFARMSITVVLASLYMWWQKTPYFPFGKPEVRRLLVARGFGGFFGVFGMYFSLLYLPLPDATVITFLAPGLACWLCSYLLKEPFTRIEQIGTFVSFAGITIIARPALLFEALGATSNGQSAGSTGDMVTGAGNETTVAGPSDASNYDNVTPTQHLIAVGIALTGVCGAVCAYTTIRWIGKRAHPVLSTNYFAVWCTIVSAVVLLVSPDVSFTLPADLKEWALLGMLGTCGFVMQFLLAAGLSYEKSSRATNMSYTQMLFALAADKVVLHHTPDTLSIIGSSLILGSAIVVALQQSTNSSQKDMTEGSAIQMDEEAQQGLLGHRRGVSSTGEEDERMPIQEVQLRTLR